MQGAHLPVGAAITGPDAPAEGLPLSNVVSHRVQIERLEAGYAAARLRCCAIGRRRPACAPQQQGLTPIGSCTPALWATSCWWQSR